MKGQFAEIWPKDLKGRRKNIPSILMRDSGKEGKFPGVGEASQRNSPLRSCIFLMKKR